MAINFAGNLYDDSGNAIQGATVQLLQTSDGAQEGSADTTDSNGAWSFSESDQDTYDIKITRGSQIRYIRWGDQISLKEIDVRNSTGATTPAATFTNLTNNASNQAAIFRSDRGTGNAADGDEAYISFVLRNDNNEEHEFARITGEAVDVTNGQEDGQIRFGVAKTNGAIEDVFTINSTTGGETSMTLDVSGDITLDADGDDIFFKAGGTTFGSATNTSGNLIIKSGTTTALTFSGANVTAAGTYTGGGLMTTGGSIVIPDAGNIGAASDTDAIAISSGGVVTMNQIPVFSAGINVSGGSIAGTLATAAQGNVTSLGTLTALQVDYLNLNASTLQITDSSDTGDLMSIAVATHGATTITTTDDDAAAADFTIDADGEIVIDAADAAGTIFKIAGTAQLSIIDGSILPTTDNDIDLGSSSYQFKDAYIHGTLEADAITIGGTNVVSGSLITTLGTISAGVWQGTAIASGYIAADAITGAKIADDAIDSEHYTDGSIDNAHIADNAIDSEHYADGSIDTAHIADNQVTLAKMAGIARGKIIYGDASGDPAVLTAGGAGTVLYSDGTDIAYSKAIYATDITIGEDAQTKLDFETANEIHFDADNAEIAKITATGLTMADGENVYLGDGSSLNIATPLLAGADHTYSGITAQMLAGGAISAFDLVCIHTTTGEVVEADASASATSRVIGIAPAAISDTATGTVLLHGFIRDDTWNWTTGGVLFLSETAGAMTHTAPTTDGAFVQAVGIALEPDVVFINPSLDVIEHA